MKETLRALGHVAFLAALLVLAAFFFLGFLGQMEDEPYSTPERHSGAAAGGPP